MSAPLLELRGVEAGYGAIAALRGVSLRVEAGEIVTLIGANGAGKSSFVGLLLGWRPTLPAEPEMKSKRKGTTKIINLICLGEKV